MSDFESPSARKKYTGWIIAATRLFLAALLIAFFSTKESSPKTDISERAVVYKTAACGCCSVYTKYLPKEGVKTEAKDISKEELKEMRVKFGIPDELESCHITVIGDYFVSGHIPVEAISKLLTEKPNIAGIALAGMPSGTPGMPGPKNESWEIKAIGNDKTVSEFLSM